MTEAIATPTSEETALTLRLEEEDKVALAFKAEKQELFNSIVQHLRQQNAVATDDVRPGVPKCKFRSSTGLKCAVGCLIPDEQYEASMENFATDLVIGMLKSPLKEKLTKHLGTLFAFQTVHDHTPIHKWESEFKAYATHNGLTLSEITPKEETANEEVPVPTNG